MNSILTTVAPLAMEEAAKYIQKKTSSPANDLAAAAAENDTVVIKSILANNYSVKRTPALVSASSAGQLGAIELLLNTYPSKPHPYHRYEKQAVDGKYQKDILNAWASGMTPLLAAVKGQHYKTSKLLLEYGANPDLFPKNGATALQLAAKVGDIEIVRLLLSYDADVDLRGANGDSALIISSRFDHPHTARCLLQNGADIDAKNEKGGTALLVAARHNCVEVLEILLKKGADIHVRDKNGKSVLHQTVEGVWLIEGVTASVKEEMLRILLKAGADPYVKDKGGKTAAQRTSWLKGGDKLRKLLDSGGHEKRRRSHEQPEELRRSKTM